MLVQRINTWAATQPDRPALIEDDVSTSYAQFARTIEAVRARLEAEGLPTGQFAIVLARTTTERWVTTFALRAIGLHVANVATLEQTGDLQMRNVACVVATQDVAAEIGVMPAALGPARLISVPQEIYVCEYDASPPSRHESARPEGGGVLYTSGTTGTLKKVLIDSDSEEKMSRWRASVFSLDRNTIYHTVDFPPWTAVGGKSVPAVWFAGGCVVASSGSGRFRDFFRHRPTLTILVPTMLSGLIAARRDGDAPDAGLTLHVGGGFLPLRLAELVAKRLTPNVHVAYGCTEVNTHMGALFRSLDDLQWLAPRESIIEVTDGDGNECAVGVEGELRVRLREFDCQRYLDDPETTAKFYRDGCFYPGDLAVRREDGRIRVLGRSDDVVNVRGWKVAVAPLEERIQRSLGVDSVCIFSELDKGGAERILIALETDELPPEAARATAVRDQAGFDRIRWVAMKSFPRTEGTMNKVNRRTLRTLLN